MSYGIKLLALGSGEMFETPVWLTDYDPDGGDLDLGYPTGMVGSSSDPAEALRFPSALNAIREVQRVSTRTPVRPDGQPNKPLTVFTVEITELPE